MTGVQTCALPIFTAYLHEERRLARRTAARITTGATLALATAASLSLGPLREWTLAGLSLFDSLDFATANILMPAGGFFTCLFVGWRLDRHIFRAELTNDGRLPGRIVPLLRFLLRYLCPAVVLAVFLDNLGLF